MWKADATGRMDGWPVQGRLRVSRRLRWQREERANDSRSRSRSDNPPPAVVRPRLRRLRHPPNVSASGTKEHSWRAIYHT